MAGGDRKVKILSVNISRAAPVAYVATWQLLIENRLGVDVSVTGGQYTGSFGTPAAWRAMTGAQMETQVTADVTAATTTPERDSVT